ncbi:MAG: glutamine-hydrolyzing carbamoyl-phosphate synthase small subunit, partial [Deltaproteobacteria bacterium]|nr:glutamine-hydrolyzing carbamoyl-phosphate synthase small subunit [Deltaproteobacteria bacterium]
MSAGKPVILALADGRVFRGRHFGGEGTVTNEIVFNTSMCGYQEIITDPSYHGQMVVMTYPQIGNYGVNPEDVESRRAWVGAFIVKELSPVASSWRSRQTLDSYLAEYGILGVEGVDTRALVRHIRDRGAQMAVASTEIDDEAALVELARRTRGIVGRDLVKDVTTLRTYRWEEGGNEILAGRGAPPPRLKRASRPRRVVAYDFGVKRNILRKLVDRNFEVTVVPADTPAGKVLEMDPDGIFLSNGPGDPEPITYAIEAVRALVGKKPIFGICLGHQVLGLALGGKTYKLKFGHRGGNHPVINKTTNKVE